MQPGSWDLRPNLDAYLSDTDYAGRRVLEIGTSDGYLGFELEARGAEVWALDLPVGEHWDLMPPDDAQAEVAKRRSRELVAAIRNAFWLGHRLHSSRLRLIETRADRLPAELGMVDCCFFGNILQHLENPLRALTAGASRARERVVVTEANWRTDLDREQPLLAAFLQPRDPEGRRGYFSWFQLTPGLVERWLERLGFEIVSRREHRQVFCQRGGVEVPHFTIVAARRGDSGPP